MGNKDEPDPLCEIVGMVNNTKYYELREHFAAIAFYPDAQQKEPGAYGQIVIRADLPSSALIAAVKSRIAEVSPNIDIQFQVFKTRILGGLLPERLMARSPDSSARSPPYSRSSGYMV